MSDRNLLMKQLEREQKYCDSQTIGSEEYVASFNRLTTLRKELADLEKHEDEIELKKQDMKSCKHDKIVKNVIEGVKVVGAGIIVPVGIAVGTMAMEKEGYTFTSLCKSVINQLISKKS